MNSRQAANVYNSAAPEYQGRVRKLKQIKKDTTKMLLDLLKPGDHVLDVGCAVGYDTLMLSKKCKTYGIEVSPEMVRRARQRNQEATILAGDFLQYPFKQQFNGIFANAFIHLFPSGTDKLVLRKMHRILKSGGAAYISTTRANRSKEGWYRKKDYLSEEKRFRKYWTKRGLAQALKETGFSTVQYSEVTDPFNKRFMIYLVRKN